MTHYFFTDLYSKTYFIYISKVYLWLHYIIHIIINVI